MCVCGLVGVGFGCVWEVSSDLSHPQPQPTAPEDEEEEDKHKEQQQGTTAATTKRARRRAPAAAATAARGQGRGKAWGLLGMLRQFAARVAQFQPFWEVGKIVMMIRRSHVHFLTFGDVCVDVYTNVHTTTTPVPPQTHTPTTPMIKVMDDLDARCLCLGDGQERRDRASLTRRLVLPAPHASLVVRIDPADPRGVSYDFVLMVCWLWVWGGG